MHQTVEEKRLALIEFEINNGKNIGTPENVILINIKSWISKQPDKIQYWYERIFAKTYTMEDVMKIKSDLDVVRLPRNIVCDNKETLYALLKKLQQCHLGYSTDHKTKVTL